MSKVIYNPSRFKRKKRKVGGLFFLKIMPPLLILGGFFYLLFLTPYFQIKEIKILNSETIPENVLMDKINKVLSEKKYFFLPQDNIFLFPSRKVENLFLTEFPKIREVSIKRNFPAFVKVGIEERKMVAIWCSFPSCFFIDREGIIFESAPAIEGSLIFKINDKSERTDVGLADKIFEADFLKEIFNNKKIFEENLGVSFLEFTVLEDGTLEANASSGWKIIFDADQDIKTQVLALKKIFSEIGGEERETLEYFDLRIEGRIYYK